MQSSNSTGVKIDITDDGAVSICGTDKEKYGRSYGYDSVSSPQTSKQDRYSQEKSSASKNSVHSWSLLLEKKEWYTSPRSPKRESTR